MTNQRSEEKARIVPGQGLGRGKGRVARFDHDAIFESYKRTGSIAQVMREIGCSEMTVRRALQAMGVEFKGKGGRPRGETCKDGHDQKKWGRKTKKGWHYCGKCHSIRNNLKYHENKRKKES